MGLIKKQVIASAIAGAIRRTDALERVGTRGDCTLQQYLLVLIPELSAGLIALEKC